MEKESILRINSYEIRCDRFDTVYLLYLFTDEDLYKTIIDYDNEVDIIEIGYKNIAVSCIDNLNNNGYTKDYFIRLYQDYRAELFQNFKQSLVIHNKKFEYLDKLINLSVIDEYNSCVAYLSKIDLSSFKYNDYDIVSNLNELSNELILPLTLFSSNFYKKYDFLVLLLFVRMTLDSVEKETVIELDLTNIVNDEDEIKALKLNITSSS